LNPNGYLVLKFRTVVSEYSPLALKDHRPVLVAASGAAQNFGTFS